jgi:hypothetical protein
VKHRHPAGCLSLSLLRYVRDHAPTEHELVAHLGPAEAGRYHVLRKAGLLREERGLIVLSPHHLSSDRRAFRFAHQIFLLDEDRVLTLHDEDAG